MRTGLSRQESSGDSRTGQLGNGRPKSMVGFVRCRSQRETVCVAWCGNEGCQLCNALCLRTTARISNRRLDREGFETTVFSTEEKSYGTPVARICGSLFWRTRRLRAAISVSSRAKRSRKSSSGASRYSTPGQVVSARRLRYCSCLKGRLPRPNFLTTEKPL